MKRFVLFLVCTVLAVTTTFAQDAKKKSKDKVTFFVEEMDCQNCIKKIEKNIAFEKGVTDIKCDLATQTAEVTYRADKTDTGKLVSAFKKIGMDVVSLDDQEGKPEVKKSHDGHTH